MSSAVHVIATTLDGTRAALAVAVPLAKGCDAHVVILVPRIVSCHEELDAAAESTDLLARRYEHIARELGAEAEVRVCASIGLDDFITSVCRDHPRVVVGGPAGRWLTSPEERFANRLARGGCHVIFATSGANVTQRRVAA